MLLYGLVAACAIISNAHLGVLESNSGLTAIQINPIALQPKIFVKQSDPKALVAFNASYFWKEQPIGWLKDFEMIPSVLQYEKARPVFAFDLNGKPSIRQIQTEFDLYEYMVVFQAGPTLVVNKKPVYSASQVSQQFKSDVMRKTSHVAIGITDAGKIVVVYGKSISIKDLATKLIKFKCHTAINLDGGSSASLRVGDKIWGNPKPKIGLQFLQNR